ncbi:hypothetical protein [Gordonia malaquae]|uniref:hypothetical protein n=1 Tax=Gordonia malaquae TaxID=410332 RepID=UPI0030FF1247
MVGLRLFGVDDRRRGGFVFRIERLAVPREIRGAFARGTLSAGAGFASSGVLTATTGLFLVRYLGIASHTAIGAIVCLIFTCVALGQLAHQTGLGTVGDARRMRGPRPIGRAPRVGAGR